MSGCRRSRNLAAGPGGARVCQADRRSIDRLCGQSAPYEPPPVQNITQTIALLCVIVPNLWRGLVGQIRMIANFRFSEIPPSEHIVLDLAWSQDGPVGRVRTPQHLFGMLEHMGMSPKKNDEYMRLPIALGYGVMVAGVTAASLVVSGDATAWPPKWGDLVGAEQNKRQVYHA